ncbi:NAD(P)H-hydrate dehydratase [Mucilaginibacter koreensis]
MLPLLTSAQIREADAYTIAHEPVSSTDLMERAAKAFTGWFINHFPDSSQAIAVYCGTGNNGGDGLAVARLLHGHGYGNVTVKVARFSDKTTDDFNANLQRLQSTGIKLLELNKGENFPAEESTVIIDALLGSGLNKPLSGDFERLVKHLNSLNKTVVAVDIPTGMPAEGGIDPDAIILQTDLVITFQQPKINFLLPESGKYIECFEVVNIGINEGFVQSLQSPYQLVEEKDVRKILPPRQRFSNKGSYGHALIVAGQAKTMGAALICSSACAYAGAGLTTACIPESGLVALNTYQPEVMAVVRQGSQKPDIDWEKFSVIGVGPGLGKDDDTLALLKDMISNYKKPIVFDADALNLLAQHPELLTQLPENSVLTPHMKEFDRLFGEHQTWWQRLQTLKQKTVELKICIILKNDYTITATPAGRLYFNSTSNAAMASGGMGDALTGIITALIAQKHSPQEACIIGNYIHGKAGDELALPNRMRVVLPGKLIEQLPVTMARLTGA